MAGSKLAAKATAALARLALALLVASTFLLTDILPQAGVSSAAAQQRSSTLLDMLFGGPPRRRYIEEPPPRRIIRKAPSQQRKKPSSQRRTLPDVAAAGAAGATAAAAIVEKSARAKTVLVVGDFLAGSLAGGLEDAVAKNAEIKVVGASNGSSGFVRDDHYDWLANIGPLLDETKPAVIVAMMGSNDRQPLRSGGESFAARSEAWMTEYRRRVEAFAGTVKEKGVPLVWVGMPAFKFDRMSEDMAALNELFRNVATTTGGGEFVDVWEGFVDANGAFTYSGPDITGQPARLRNSDGITMTPAGSEKLAFFVEKPILRLLGATAEGTGALASVALGEPLGPTAPPSMNAANATSAPRMALTDPSLDGGEALLGGNQPIAASPDLSPRARLVLSGAPSPTSPGRADDFSWGVKPAIPEPGDIEAKGTETSTTIPRKPEEAIVFGGELDLSKLRDPSSRPPAPDRPSLADAIVEDWSAQRARASTQLPPSAAAASAPQPLDQALPAPNRSIPSPVAGDTAPR